MRIAVTGIRGTVAGAVLRGAVAAGHSVLGIDLPAPAGQPPPGPTSDLPAGSTGDLPAGKPPNEPGGPSGDLSVEPLAGLAGFAAVDVCRYDELAAAVAGCDAIVHLAAHATPLRRPAHEVHNNNVTGSYNVLVAAAELGIRHVCLASSVNAVNGEFSRTPRYEYFPLDEDHPTGNEDPYSLSKWICEQQADSVARRYPELTICSLRFHWVVPDRRYATDRHADPGQGARALWGYTARAAAARACLLSLTADFTGHERFYIVAGDTVADVPSAELHRRYHPDVPLRRELTGYGSFFDCGKAARLLGWQHDASG